MRDYSGYSRGNWGNHPRGPMHMRGGMWWLPLAFIFGFFLLTKTFWLIAPLLLFGVLAFVVAPAAIRGLGWAAKTFNSSESAQAWRDGMRERMRESSEKAKMDSTYTPSRVAEQDDTTVADKPKRRPMYIIGDDGELIEVDENGTPRNQEPPQYV